MKQRAWLLLCAAYNPANEDRHRKSHCNCFEGKGQSAVDAKDQSSRPWLILISRFFVHLKIKRERNGDRNYSKWWWARIHTFQEGQCLVRQLRFVLSTSLEGLLVCVYRGVHDTPTPLRPILYQDPERREEGVVWKRQQRGDAMHCFSPLEGLRTCWWAPSEEWIVRGNSR